MTVTVSARQLREGARHTGLLLALRWRALHSWRARLLVTFGLFLLLVVVFAASSVGMMLVRLAEQGTDTAVTEFAVNYVVALQRGEFGAIGALALGSAVAAAVFSPFTGSSNVSLFPVEDLSGLRPPRLHRYFDSLVTVAASTIGFMQLLSLTVVGALLTLDSGRAGGLLFTWAVWPVLLLLSVAEGWTLEWVHRRFGPSTRRAILGAAAAVLAVVLWLDPNHGRTLFGVGDLYSRYLVEAGRGNLLATSGAAAVIAALAAVLVWAGAVMCTNALSLPAVPTVAGTVRKRLIPISKRPVLALTQIMASQMLRSPEVYRPILTITLIGAPAGWLMSDQRETMFTLVITIPLAVALAWGVNVFGVLGPAMTWLASQPNVMRYLLGISTTLHLGAVSVVAALCWLPPVLTGRIDGMQAASLACALAVATALTTRSSAAKSVHKPYLARMGNRGDTVIPPLAAINYTMRFALWGGMAGVIVLSLSGNRQIQGVIIAAAVLWSTLRYIHLTATWLDRNTQSRVVATVADV